MTKEERRVYEAKWRANNKDKVCAASARWRARHPHADVEKHLVRTYGITLEEYNALVKKQGGLCAICKGPPNGRVKKLVVDHDHKTMKNRALLCDRCNRGIGFFDEDVSVMATAIAYINTHKEDHV